MSKGFAQVPLGDLLTQHSQYINAPEEKNYPKLSVKLYGKGVVLDPPADGRSLKMQRHQIAKSGQVILSEIWGKKGAMGFVPAEGEGALCTSHFFLFDVCVDKLEPKYLQALFKANYLQEQLDAAAKGTTGYASVRPRNFLAASIPLPPLHEQQRIVARIDKLAAKIEEANGLRREAIQEVENLLCSGIDAVFANPTMNKFTVQLQEADVEINAFSCDPRYETASQEFLYLDIGSVTTGTKIVRQAKMLLRADTPSRARRVLHKDDVIMSTVRPYLRAFAIVGEELDGAIASTGFAVMTCGRSIMPRFLLQQMNGTSFVQQCMKRATGGHYPAINDANLHKVEIVVPPLAEQAHIVAHLDGLQTKVNVLKALQTETAVELDALLPSVLDQAFAGRL